MSMKDVSAQAVKHFLKTAVIIDERAFSTPTSSIVVADDEGKTQAEEDGEQRIEVGDIDNDSDEVEGPGHELETETVVRGFAQKGMICSVLSPKTSGDEDTRDLVIFSAKEADVTIFDWEIYNDNGTYTLDTIEKILGSTDSAQLRLIVIYTGVPNTDRILDAIKTRIDRGNLKLNSVKGATEKENCLASEFLRFCVLTKPGSIVGGVGTNIENIDFSQLADRVIDEFSVMAPGLLRSLTLHSLATLREKAHAVLARVSDKLDPAYVSHRMLLPHPDDAQGHVVAYLAEEFRSILDESKVSEYLDYTVVNSWLSEAKGCEKTGTPEFQLSCIAPSDTKQSVSFPLTEAGLLLKVGLTEWLLKAPATITTAIKKGYMEKRFHHSATQMLLADEDAAWESDALFSIFSSLEYTYSQDTIPFLSFGSIIKDYDGRYLLCIQPLCDSIRLSNNRSFPFLPFVSVDKNAATEDPMEHLKAYDLVIFDSLENKFVPLKLKNKSFETQMISFKPDKTEEKVNAQKNGDIWEFLSTEKWVPPPPTPKPKGYMTPAATNKKYQWVANMKVRHTQRIVNQFGSYIARVGVNESEWLRRSAPSTSE